MTDPAALIARALADLDDEVLIAISGSAGFQSEYLGGFPRKDTEAQAMAAICGVIATLAESALIERRTGVTIAP